MSNAERRVQFVFGAVVFPTLSMVANTYLFFCSPPTWKRVKNGKQRQPNQTKRPLKKETFEPQAKTTMIINNDVKFC